MTTDTTEKGLESVIVTAMTGVGAATSAADGVVNEPTALYGGTGWVLGDWRDYDRDYAVDLVQLRTFLDATQRKAADALDLANDGPTRQKLLARLQGEVTKRGVVDVLRRGIKHNQHELDLFYGTPSPGNQRAAERFAANRFSVTRQLRYSQDATQLALDLCLFVNGLPIATFELKNSLTKQTVDDAVRQYQRDRDPRELPFVFGRCLAHFAVDDQAVRFCTHLKGKSSWFLPFDQGWNDGAHDEAGDPGGLHPGRAAHDVRRQTAVGHQGGPDSLAAQPRAPAEVRRVRARLPERRRDDPGVSCSSSTATTRTSSDGSRIRCTR